MPLTRFAAQILFAALTISLLLCPLAFAQSDISLEQGMKPYGSFMGGNIDSVSLSNGNLTLHIPLVSYPQRGGRLSLTFFLRYNNKGYHIASQTFTNGLGLKQTASHWVWDGVGVDVQRDQLWEYRSNEALYSVPGDNGTQTVPITTYSVTTPDGSSHTTAVSRGAYTFGDGMMDGAELGQYGVIHLIDPTNPITTPTSCPGYSYLPTSWYPVLSQDPNGNKISTTVNGWVDTLGRLIPGQPNCPVVYPVTGPTPTNTEQGIYAGGNGGNIEVRMFPGVSTTNLSGCPSNTVSARNWYLPEFANSSSSQPNTTALIKLCYA
jgi:hypothetical protein